MLGTRSTTTTITYEYEWILYMITFSASFDEFAITFSY
jgi:hypothetical protein